MAQFIEENRNKSEVELKRIADQCRWTEKGDDAAFILHERDQAEQQKSREEELARHKELLDEIKRPHWSVTPGFLVGVAAMVASCIAAYYAYLGYYSQAQSPVAVVAPSMQIAPAVLDSSSSSHTQSAPASMPLSSQAKK
jgi:hypothetical protein